MPIDIKLQKETDFQYIRYVDDIRLFGRTESDVRQAAIQLEQECRNRGLIPQSTKFNIRKLNSANEAMGSLPSITPTDGQDNTESQMTEKQSLRILRSAIGGKPQKIKDKSRFRYVMYRAPKNNEILNIVLRLLPRHPEHIDAFTYYFFNYGNSIRIAKAALKYLESGVPYTYVRGELWHVVARLSRNIEMQAGLSLARKDSKRRKQCIALSWGVMHFLMKCEEARLCRIGTRLNAEHPISRSLLAPVFAEREFLPTGHAITLLKGSLMEQLAGSRELQKRNFTLSLLNLRQKNLPNTCSRALKSLGVIRRQRSKRRDWIGERLVRLYNCKSTSIWRDLLNTEYEYALQFLIEAEEKFTGARSYWLALQDSFFDILTRKFFEFTKEKEIKNLGKTQKNNKTPINYGKLIEREGNFDMSYPNITKSLRLIHDRRNRIPNSHPYNSKGGAQNEWLTIKERNRLVFVIRNSINDIVTIVEKSM